MPTRRPSDARKQIVAAGTPGQPPRADSTRTTALVRKFIRATAYNDEDAELAEAVLDHGLTEESLQSLSISAFLALVEDVKTGTIERVKGLELMRAYLDLLRKLGTAPGGRAGPGRVTITVAAQGDDRKASAGVQLQVG